MPKLIRRRPLKDKILDYLNPLDFWLWLSEEIETREWDAKAIANPVGVGLNFVFLLARANSASLTKASDDVFGDDRRGAGWLGWFVSSTRAQLYYILTEHSHRLQSQYS